MFLLRRPREPKPVRQTRPPEVEVKTPPGQFVTDKFPVLSYGSTPRVDLKEWRFRVTGRVEQEMEWTWEEFLALGHIIVTADFHCVTQWSRLDNTWEGVPFREVMQRVRPLPLARYVMVHCYGGYTANLSLEALTEADVLFANRHDGQPLAPEHGGPLRLVVPKRYGWKSAKWVRGLELLDKDQPGFWEGRGYHMEGDPWKEQRFW
jgi:DMSO/TMAO reductase YedYZ molybdopterin-dependent catalytic subunit